MLSLAEAVLFHARNTPERPAIATPRIVITYADLAVATWTCASRLQERGIGNGAVVAIAIEDVRAHVAIILAAELLGAASVSTQTASVLESSGLVPDLLIVEEQPQPAPAYPVAVADRGWFLHKEQDRAVAVDRSRWKADDLHRVILSSGTTGFPKAIALDRGVFTARLRQWNTVFPGITLPVRSLCTMGISTLANYMVLADTLTHGGMMGFANSTADFLKVIRTFEISSFLTAPGQLQFFVNELAGREPPPSLRRVMVGGSRIQLKLLEHAQRQLCTNIVTTYGAGETGLVAQATVQQLQAEDGLAGIALPWAKVEIVDESHHPVPSGNEGIIRASCEGQARYLIPSAEDALLFRDGWFYPGDVGRITAEGVIFVSGRTNELINRGGNKIAPELLEGLLRAQAGIVDAAVFGVRDADGIEQIWAAVVATGDFDEARTIRSCEEQMPGKAPSVIRKVEAIPRNAGGKIQREELRSRLKA